MIDAMIGPLGDEEPIFYVGVVPFCWDGNDLVTYRNGDCLSISLFLSWHEKARQTVRGMLLQRACKKWIA